MDGWMDGAWIYGLMDRWISGWMDEWIYGQMWNKCPDKYTDQ